MLCKRSLLSFRDANLPIFLNPIYSKKVIFVLGLQSRESLLKISSTTSTLRLVNGIAHTMVSYCISSGMF